MFDLIFKNETSFLYIFFFKKKTALFQRISLAEAVCMTETGSSFYKRAAIDNSISSMNCTISFKNIFSTLRRPAREKAKKDQSSKINTSLVLVIALGVSTCCLVGFLICLIAKFISEKKQRPVTVIPTTRVPLHRGERQQQNQEPQAGPSSALATTVTHRSQEVLMTESHFRNYDSLWMMTV